MHAWGNRRVIGTAKEEVVDAVFYSPKELRKMARREYQDPPLKKTAGLKPRWYVRVRQRVGKGPRQQGRIYLGYCAEMKIQQANRERAAKLAEINGQVFTIPSNVLLQDFVLIYNEKHLPTLGTAAQSKYRLQLTNHIVPAFGKWKLSAIGTEEIQAFLNQKETRCGTCRICKDGCGVGCKGLSWWTRTDLRNILSSIYTKAEDWGYWTAKNPVARASCGRQRNKRVRKILTDAQLTALIEALPVDVALIVKVADTTGMRISEILGLKWKNVDLMTGWLYVRERQYRGDEDIPKSERSIRGLALGNLVEEMRDHLKKTRGEDEDHVFQHPNGGPYDDRNLNQHFLRKAAKSLGFYFEGFGFHSFRRGAITGVQEHGASTIEASQMAGHSRPAVTNQYTIVQQKRQEELVVKRQGRFQVKK